MDWQLFALSFATIFASELGDKSQLATLSLSGSSGATKAVFIGSSLALLLASLIGVIFGEQIGHFMPTRVLKAIAALLFAIMALRLLLGQEQDD